MKEILDIFGIDTRLLLIQAFNFGILLLALWYFLYRPVLTMLEKRQQVIEDGVHDAQTAKEEKEKVLKEKESILVDATHEAGTIMDRAKERAGEKEALIVREAEVKGRRALAEAHERAQEERRKVLEAGKEEIARMAVLGAEKVLQNRKNI